MQNHRHENFETVFFKTNPILHPSGVIPIAHSIYFPVRALLKLMDSPSPYFSGLNRIIVQLRRTVAEDRRYAQCASPLNPFLTFPPPLCVLHSILNQKDDV